MFVTAARRSSPLLFAALFEELLAGVRRFVLDETAGDQLPGERFQVFEAEPFGPKAIFERFLDLFERLPPVEQS